ncbi:MAG: aminopeptidase P family protein [Kiritimatiellae bacterium]|nr:aminopeptidase P family protein [Kiritimatiellia bacterium]
MNPKLHRLEQFARYLQEEQLSAALVYDEFNVRALTGIECDNACLVVLPDAPPIFYTDFRYVPMVHRVAPELKVKDIKKVVFPGKRAGYEPSMSHARFLALQKAHPGVEFVDVEPKIKELRAVKTPEEIEKLRAVEALNDKIWSLAQERIRPGMTEREMARVIQVLMVEHGDGEAFATIVCVGKHAAECHHVPDDTVWNGKEPVLVDMGVKLDGVCADMTRNIVPKTVRGLYRKIYKIVLEANEKAIAGLRPGMTGKALDKIARDHIAKAGYGKAFGHSLGHGVGYQVHEAPNASSKSKMKLLPGMFVTIEPGIYLEGKLGVRIEDLVQVTSTGCTVVSHSAK